MANIDAYLTIVKPASGTAANAIPVKMIDNGDGTYSLAVGTVSGGSGGAVTVSGDVAAAATDSGNPVKTGGKYNSTKPTYTNGQRGDTQIEANGATSVSLYGKVTAAGDTPLMTDANGNLRVVLYANATNTQMATAGADADGANQSSSRPFVGSNAFGYNGALWDRWRNNISVSALASAARTGTANADVTTYNARTFLVILNITAAPNTASTLTPAIRIKDSISGNYITVLTGAAITGSVVTGAVPNTTRYVVGAGVITAANVSAPEALARTMNAIVTHSNSDSWTYSVSVELGA